MHSFSEMLQRNSLLRVNFHRYLLKLLILLFYCQISYLGIVRGRSEEDTVERVLSATISNDLARMFNWNGLKGKRCFRKLQLTKVVFVWLYDVLHSVVLMTWLTFAVLCR